jgi:sugar phosphate permease
LPNQPCHETPGGARVKPVAYAYRWVILAVFALLNIVIEMHWVALAPVTGEAAAYYRVTPMSIGFLSMVFMLVYIVVSMPASYIIDTCGLRRGIGAGAALIGVFGLLKGLCASNYAMVVVCQVGLAVAQPFILNAYTGLAAKWFPMNERATATGLAALSQYLGIIVAMAVTPFVVRAYGIGGMFLAYGVVAMAAAVLFFLLFRDQPPTPSSSAGDGARLSVGAGLRHIFRQPQMLLLLGLFFIGIGIFNALTTWIEQILAPRGFSEEQAGIAGAAMILGGVIGASILPPLSDRLRRRVPFLLMSTLLTIPGLAGLAFARSYPVLLCSSFLLGLFTMSAGPIGFQYGAELCHPAPESTSQGLLLLAGQISGAAFIYGMYAFRSDGGSMTPFMLLFIALTVVNAFLCARLTESRLLREKE